MTSFVGRPDLLGRIQLADLLAVPGYTAAVAVISTAAVEYVDHGTTELTSGVLAGVEVR
ncbi:hypothetical protein [Streptomyces sp. DT203]|uniref:hypothetical protein n=1 Tax=Streptomyces sp. DT203 TaxID=3393424 RepID=UPI003CE8D935